MQYRPTKLILSLQSSKSFRIERISLSKVNRSYPITLLLSRHIASKIPSLKIRLHVSCSEYDGRIDDLSVGDEVEFNITSKGGKVAAEKLIKLPSGSIPQEVYRIHMKYYFVDIGQVVRRSNSAIHWIAIFFERCKNAQKL